MSWSKEEFIEFCTRCGVDPQKALKEGKVSLRAPVVTGATLGAIKANQQRKNDATRAFLKLQDSLREPDQKQVALEKGICGQAEGMECAKASFRISIIGLRVRPIDPDNFAAGCKGIIDGIVTSGIIPDDNWNTVEITCSQSKVTAFEKEGTLVVVESL